MNPLVAVLSKYAPKYKKEEAKASSFLVHRKKGLERAAEGSEVKKCPEEFCGHPFLPDRVTDLRYIIEIFSICAIIKLVRLHLEVLFYETD